VGGDGIELWLDSHGHGDEFLHTATLVHDDVIDEQRLGAITLNQ